MYSFGAVAQANQSGPNQASCVSYEGSTNETVCDEPKYTYYVKIVKS